VLPCDIIAGFATVVFTCGYQRIAELKIQLYPLSTTTKVGVKLELQKRDGAWTLSPNDRLFGKQ
jgi:hypothetical protein